MPRRERAQVCAREHNLLRGKRAALVAVREFLEQRGYEALCFDPLLAPGSAWWTREGTILLSDYRRSIEEICPIFEKLGEEAVGQFCQASHLREEPFVRWPDAGIEEIAADIRARVEELIDCDDS